MNYQEIQVYINLANTLLTVVVGAYVWWDKYKLRVAKRIEAVEKEQGEHKGKIKELASVQQLRSARCDRHSEKLNKHELELKGLETEMKNLPTKDTIIELNKNITALTGKIAEVDGRLGGINRAVDLMNQHLLAVD